MIKRFAEKHLADWLANTRRKPLVLRGARQVGKSTLVRQFAGKAGLVLNEINLERHPALDDIFKEKKSLVETAAVHREIINTYQFDFSKYAKSSQLLLLHKVFICTAKPWPEGEVQQY